MRTTTPANGNTDGAATTAGGDDAVVPAATTTKMFHIYCRFRPFNRRERSSASTSIIRAARSDERQVRVLDTTYRFDRVFYESTDQQTFFEQSIRDHVRDFIDQPYDLNILTYGQTSSGKTWTVDGGSATSLAANGELHPSCGLTPRIVDVLCRTRVASPGSGRLIHRAKIQHYEIYCERVYDLLHHTDAVAELRMSEASGGHVILRDPASLVVPLDEPDPARRVLAALAACKQRRHFAGTAMNDESSRAHTFLDFVFPEPRRRRSRQRGGGGGHVDQQGGATTPSDTGGGGEKVLRIIDLAGSERATRTLATDQTLREGIKINNSLMYLKKMIDIIATTAHKQQQQVPKFRESKLTRLLYSSVSDMRSRILLILCCSPASDSVCETVHTLQFGCTASRIQRHLVEIVALDPTDAGARALSTSDAAAASAAALSEAAARFEAQIQTAVERERAAALARLRDLEQQMERARREERDTMDRNLRAYEARIAELQTSMRTARLENETELQRCRRSYLECRETLELQARIIREITADKMNMQNEINVLHNFKDHITRTLLHYDEVMGLNVQDAVGIGIRPEEDEVLGERDL